MGGLKIDNPEAEFKAIDKNGGGIILFDEFADWALRKQLDLRTTTTSRTPPWPNVFRGPRPPCDMLPSLAGHAPRRASIARTIWCALAHDAAAPNTLASVSCAYSTDAPV